MPGAGRVVAVRVGAGVPLRVGDGVELRVEVGAGTGVPLLVGDGVPLPVGVGLGVGVELFVGVGVELSVGAGVALCVGDGSAVRVGDGDWVGAGVVLPVGAGVALCVGGGGVALADAVGVSDGAAVAGSVSLEVGEAVGVAGGVDDALATPGLIPKMATAPEAAPTISGTVNAIAAAPPGLLVFPARCWLPRRAMRVVPSCSGTPAIFRLQIVPEDIIHNSSNTDLTLPAWPARTPGSRSTRSHR